MRNSKVIARVKREQNLFIFSYIALNLTISAKVMPTKEKNRPTHLISKNK